MSFPRHSSRFQHPDTAIDSTQRAQLLRELRVRSHVQWREVDGMFVTFSGSIRERDSLAEKGLITSLRRVPDKMPNDTVLAVTPQQAQDWLAMRKDAYKGNGR
jgi:hypothetical protein